MMAPHQGITAQVEEMVDQALKHNFRALEEFLLNESREGIASKCSKQFMSKLDKLINRELDQQNVKNASVVFTIFHKLGNTLVFPGGRGISLMVSQGLVRKMVQWFEKARKIWLEAGPTRNELLINLAEDFFDALMVVHECCKEGTFQVTESLLHHIGKLASDPRINILIQKEAVRKLNMILRMIPLELKKGKKILSSQEASNVMSDLASRILKGGDYDLQVALMEGLCRMTSRVQRRELADQWFGMEFVASAFTKIQDSEFETDCRIFLNLVNGMQGDNRSVYSYPCLEVFLDKHALLMPVDENLNEFWIDFNLGSQSISFYCCLADDEESQWDTLCITENEVHSYTVKEEKDIKVLQLVLTEPVCLSSIEGTRLSIHFSSSLDILKTTKKVYGETKNKRFIGKTTTSVVKTTVQIILDEGGSQVLFPESQGSSQLMGKKCPSVRSDTQSQLQIPHERDARNVNQQMITPLRSKVSESCMYISGSAGRKLGRSPFSCVLPASASGKAKVKPALQMMASSEKKKEVELKELLTAKSAPALHGPEFKQGREGQQLTEKYSRHIPVEKVVEIVQADQELQEEPLDNSIVLDSQPAVWKETSLLSSPSCPNRKRISVSGSLLPCQPPSHQSKLEPPQQTLSAQRSSEGLSHKELHAQLTQRLEQVLREREQQEQNPPEIRAADKETGLLKKLHGPTPTEQSIWAKGSGTDRSNNTTEKAAQSMVKQIKSHYNETAFSAAAQEQVSWFNTAPTNRYSFNRSWCPNSVARISAHTPGLLNSSSAYQAKEASDQNKDIYAFGLDAPELSKKKSRRSSEKSGMNSSSSLTLSTTSKKCLPVKLADCHAKKHLFSDTDTDNMTETSWLNSANRRPKPKLADYTRQPVKLTHPPANIRSAMTSTDTLRSALAPVVPVCKQAQTPQVRQSSSVQAIVQERHNDVHSDQTEKENEQAGKHGTHLMTGAKLTVKKEVSEVLGFEQSLNKTILLPSTSTKETWASKQTSLYHSPFSIEKMRSAEKNASVPKSTPLQPLCISPVGAISPTLELPSHVRGIQASSFYRTSGGRDSAAYLPHSFATPIVQGQTAQKNAELSSRQLFVPPLIASTGREKGSSLLNSPDPEEELKGFLNNTSQDALQASFDKESVISLVTLSQSSHTSMKNVSVICTELEKTPASVQGGSDGKAESGPTTTRTWHTSQLCNCTSLSERDDSEDEDKMTKTGPGELAVRMKPRKLFNPNVSQPSMKKGSKQPMQVGSSVEEGEKESVTGDVEMCSTVVSSCWEPSVKADMDLVQSEVSTSQEMGYVCRQFSSEFKRKFENRSRRMDLFTKQSLKACKQHVSTITMKVQQYRSQRLETVKQVLMEEIKNMEQDERSLRNMETELTGYWKKQALSFHSYHERETQRLNNLKSTIATNASQNLDYEEQIFFSQMHLMKKDMKSVQDHLFRQMHEDELQNVRRGLQTFLSDVPMFLK